MMGGRQSEGFTSPSEQFPASPITNPTNHIVDLTFIIQNVADQRQSLGEVKNELSNLKSSIELGLKDINTAVRKIDVIETKMSYIERDIGGINQTLNSNFSDLKLLIEKSSQSQKDHTELKLNPINQSISKIESDYKKLDADVEALKSFRWKFAGGIIVFTTLISVGAALLIRLLTK